MENDCRKINSYTRFCPLPSAPALDTACPSLGCAQVDVGCDNITVVTLAGLAAAEKNVPCWLSFMHEP